ncbi:Large neutral amino acids transporter small subunit 1, partial [Orchesella cincta]
SQGVYIQSQDPYVAIGVWVACGVFSMIGALSFAELGTCITRSGGDYAYILEAFGPLPAFMCLWVTVFVIRPTTAAVIALTFADYAINPILDGLSAPKPSPELLAAACLMLLTAVNCWSVKVTMKIQDLFTVAKLLALGAIIVAGLICLIWGLVSDNSPTDLSKNAFTIPFDRKGEPYSYASLSLAAYNGLFAYAGWNYLNMVTNELIDPYKNLPRAIWIGLPLVTIIYVLANIAYFIVLSPHEIINSNAVAVDFGAYTFDKIWEWFRPLIPISVALSCFGGVNGTLFTSSRMFFAGADDGQLPKVLACIHVRNLTPIPALLLQCIIAVGVLFTGEIFALILRVMGQHRCGGCCPSRLRKTKPDLPRPIKVPLALPIIYIVCTFLLIGFSIYEDPINTGIGAAITLTGIPVYYIGQLLSVPMSVTIFLQKVMNVIPQEKSEALL